MKKSLILFILLFCCVFNVYSQNNIVFGLGTSATSRLTNFHNNDYTDSERNQLKKLEIVKPSYFAYLGYIFEYNLKIDVQLNLGYRLNRYGSRIYTIPNDIQNITPQYPKTKEVIHQNQFNLDCILKFKSVKLIKSDYLFVKSSLVYNYGNYKIRRGSFDFENKGNMSGVLKSEGFTPHTFDMYIGTGLSYNLCKEKLSFQPFIGAFIRPYETDGKYYSYLYFNKDVKGFLWDVGINLQYKLK